MLLQRGTGLKAADRGGTSDPYVVVRLGKAEKKSAVVEKTLEPEWNETIDFGHLTLGAVMGTPLVLSVWDHDDGVFDRDDALGRLKVRRPSVTARRRGQRRLLRPHACALSPTPFAKCARLRASGEPRASPVADAARVCRAALRQGHTPFHRHVGPEIAAGVDRLT